MSDTANPAGLFIAALIAAGVLAFCLLGPWLAFWRLGPSSPSPSREAVFHESSAYDRGRCDGLCDGMGAIRSGKCYCLDVADSDTDQP